VLHFEVFTLHVNILDILTIDYSNFDILYSSFLVDWQNVFLSLEASQTIGSVWVLLNENLETVKSASGPDWYCCLLVHVSECGANFWSWMDWCGGHQGILRILVTNLEWYTRNADNGRVTSECRPTAWKYFQSLQSRLGIITFAVVILQVHLNVIVTANC